MTHKILLQLYNDQILKLIFRNPRIINTIFNSGQIISSTIWKFDMLLEAQAITARRKNFYEFRYYTLKTNFNCTLTLSPLDEWIFCAD